MSPDASTEKGRPFIDEQICGSSNRHLLRYLGVAEREVPFGEPGQGLDTWLRMQCLGESACGVWIAGPCVDVDELPWREGGEVGGLDEVASCLGERRCACSHPGAMGGQGGLAQGRVLAGAIEQP